MATGNVFKERMAIAFVPVMSIMSIVLVALIMSGVPVTLIALVVSIVPVVFFVFTGRKIGKVA
ncbi:hypothetical protein [Shouchella clausii]|uniref:hypothetical protein n=1 Tax=Shouchella clausii TaxID=79880 RepID=UPI000BA5014D|nr:hypothetical protein [Shouchella clausii]PAD40936.1 hypothetical protein CHH54_19910 [Bacillus sp. 7520-S]MBU8596417.1 hypothetical protein [Shouchella clausii]MCY1104076.1 hypothetical protein [Shouchella clausii]MED4160050.1 hypothetical protein [Shouchella clausii]MED4178315.1 hypothetical protein [Shouchella clausii]